MVMSTRFGRLWPIAIVTVLSIAGIWILHHAADATMYLWAIVLLSFGWAFVVPYLFGITAALDKAGQLAALGGTLSKIGLATGPLVGALLLKNGSFGLLINTGVLAMAVGIVAVAVPAFRLDRVCAKKGTHHCCPINIRQTRAVVEAKVLGVQEDRLAQVPKGHVA